MYAYTIQKQDNGIILLLNFSTIYQTRPASEAARTFIIEFILKVRKLSRERAKRKFLWRSLPRRGADLSLSLSRGKTRRFERGFALHAGPMLDLLGSNRTRQFLVNAKHVPTFLLPLPSPVVRRRSEKKVTESLLKFAPICKRFREV